MVVALAITGDNGLPFTSVPEIAGRYWSGRALGTQNTVERMTVAVGPPVFGALITATGYPLAFAVCGLFPLARCLSSRWSPTDPRRRPLHRRCERAEPYGVMTCDGSGRSSGGAWL